MPSPHLIGQAPASTPADLRAGIALPPALEHLVLACLAKAPDARPQSAAELERSLAALALEPWTQEQAAAWWNNLS